MPHSRDETRVEYCAFLKAQSLKPKESRTPIEGERAWNAHTTTYAATGNLNVAEWLNFRQLHKDLAAQFDWTIATAVIREPGVPLLTASPTELATLKFVAAYRAAMPQARQRPNKGGGRRRRPRDSDKSTPTSTPTPGGKRG